jgi:hypothetical protein
VRYRTATILSIVVVGVMLGLPFALNAVLAPYLEHGLEIPRYVRIFLNIGFLLWRHRWWLTPVTVGMLFLVAAVTYKPRLHKRGV